LDLILPRLLLPSVVKISKFKVKVQNGERHGIPPAMTKPSYINTKYKLFAIRGSI